MSGDVTHSTAIDCCAKLAVADTCSQARDEPGVEDTAGDKTHDHFALAMEAKRHGVSGDDRAGRGHTGGDRRVRN